MKHKDASTDIQHTTTKVQKGTMVLVGVWHRRTNMVWNRQKVKSYSTFILASCKKDYFLSFNKKHWICFSFQFKCFYYLHLGLFLLPRKLAFYPEISGSESFWLSMSWSLEQMGFYEDCKSQALLCLKQIHVLKLGKMTGPGIFGGSRAQGHRTGAQVASTA